MDSEPTATAILLQRCHAGDGEALRELVATHLARIHALVEHKLGPLLRGRGDTMDYVHDAIVHVMQKGPQFVVTDPERFRALLARLVENLLRDRADWFRAGKRDVGLEQPLASGSAVSLDLAASQTRPSEAASAAERRTWLNLALQLLTPEDREVVLLRQQQGLSFQEVGDRLGVPANTARMRFERAVQRLGRRFVGLRSGRLEAALGPDPEPAPES